MRESLFKEECVHHLPIFCVHIGEETLVGIFFLRIEFEPDLPVEDKHAIVFLGSMGHKITLLPVRSNFGGIDFQISHPGAILQKDRVSVKDKNGKTLPGIGRCRCE